MIELHIEASKSTKTSLEDGKVLLKEAKDMIQTQELANQTSSKLMIHASKAEVELKMKQKGLNNLRTSARSFEETLEGSEGNEKLDQRVFQEVIQECKSTLDHSMNLLKKEAFQEKKKVNIYFPYQQ